jgi:hypothetical protein
MYLCDSWYTLYVLVDCWLAWMEWNSLFFNLMVPEFNAQCTVEKCKTLHGCPLLCILSAPLGPHPPTSAHSKKPSATQPTRLSRYGRLKAEVIY